MLNFFLYCTFAGQNLTGSSQADMPSLEQFKQALTELSDWLSHLDHMMQNKRAIVGDPDQINQMIVKQKVSLILYTPAWT